MAKEQIKSNPTTWIEDILLNTNQTASIFAAIKPGQIADHEKIQILRGIKYHDKPNAYEPLEPIGFITLKNLNHLMERHTLEKAYPTHLPVQEILIQKIKTKTGDRSLIYMLPLQETDETIIGADLFEKKRTLDHQDSLLFIGCISLKRYQEFLKNKIPKETAHTYPYADESEKIKPDVTFPLQAHHYKMEKKSSCFTLMALKEKISQK